MLAAGLLIPPDTIGLRHDFAADSRMPLRLLPPRTRRASILAANTILVTNARIMLARPTFGSTAGLARAGRGRGGVDDYFAFSSI